MREHWPYWVSDSLFFLDILGALGSWAMTAHAQSLLACIHSVDIPW